eukprot:844251-Pyramimonas_sp.AAC.1
MSSVGAQPGVHAAPNVPNTSAAMHSAKAEGASASDAKQLAHRKIRVRGNVSTPCVATQDAHLLPQGARGTCDCDSGFSAC